MADKDRRRPDPSGGRTANGASGTANGSASPEPLVPVEHRWRPAVAAELFWIEETCSCAAMCQEETGRVWRVINLLVGGTAVLTAGVAGSMMLAGGRFGVAAGALALASALLTAVIGMIAPGRRESRAVESAKAFQTVQALARQARQVDLAGQYFEQARDNLEDLTDRWREVNQAAVPVSRWAQVRAGRHMGPDGADEAMTERVSDLVNVFVPAPPPTVNGVP